MDCHLRKVVSRHQKSAVNAPECMSGMNARGRRSAIQLLPHLEEIICPEPRRAACPPFVVDTANKFCYKPQSNLPVRRGDPDLEILGIFLNKDKHGADMETSSPRSFFCGSPPVRTNNPLVHDAQFVRQTQPDTPASSSSHGGKSSRVESFPSSSCGASSLGGKRGVSSFGGKPLVRIEGFVSGNVPALA